MEKILMGIPVGYAALTLLGYFFIIFRLPFLIIPTVLIAIILGWKRVKKELRAVKIKFDRKLIVLFIVFVVGIIGQLAVISPSGRFINGDLVFWSSHGHDASWHIGLMNEIKNGWPFQNPVFSGEKLVNYHFFSNILPALVSKYWPGSNVNLDLDLYFRIFPFIYSLLFGTSAYFLTKRITNNFSARVWAVIFSYFGGSFGYIATYIKDKTIGGESIFWATQPHSSSGNPPQIVSNFLALTFLYFAYSYIKNKSKTSLLASVLILGTLTEFKVYAAIVLLGATLISGLWQIAIPAGLIAMALYLPNSSGGTSFLIFEPWWYIRTMIVEPSRLNWVDLELRRQTYIYEHNWKRVLSIELSGFLIFFFGNLGIRFIGLWDFLKSAKTLIKNKFNRMIVSTILLSLTLPLLFLQKGVASNTGQFLQYFILLFGILSGITAANIIKLLKRPLFQVAFGFLLLVLMIPTQAALIYSFYSRPPLAKISATELEGLNYIKLNTDKNAVILSPPFNSYIRQPGPTPDIWAWSDTGYVAAFSNRREYFSDKEQVDIMGYNFPERENIRKTIFESDNAELVKEKISNSEVSIIYYPKALSPKVDFSLIGLTSIYENTSVAIWKTN